MLSRNTSEIINKDILIANEMSNESLLSKNDVLHSMDPSKRNMKPKFTASRSPTMPIESARTSSNKYTKVDISGSVNNNQ
jgi:hypothetical protein